HGSAADGTADRRRTGSDLGLGQPCAAAGAADGLGARDGRDDRRQQSLRGAGGEAPGQRHHRRPCAQPRGARAGAGRCGTRQPGFCRGHCGIPRKAPATVLMTTTRPRSRTLGDLVDELAAATPQAPALVSGTERLDFAALKARTDGFARALLALGIGRGDRVALLCSNRSEWVVAAGAAAKLGAPVVAISTFSSPRELAYALKHSGAKALVMLNRFRDRHFLQALAELCPELARCPPGALQSAALPDLASVVVLDGDASPGTLGPQKFLTRGAGVDAAALPRAQAS